MQVVCLKEPQYLPGEPRGTEEPKLHGIYTIKSIVTGWNWNRTECGIGYILVELAPVDFGVGWASWMFRPCAPTDIGALRALLAPKPARGRKVEVVE